MCDRQRAVAAWRVHPGTRVAILAVVLSCIGGPSSAQLLRPTTDPTLSWFTRLVSVASVNVSLTTRAPLSPDVYARLRAVRAHRSDIVGRALRHLRERLI